LGETITPALKKLLKEKRITRSSTHRTMVTKELKASRSDLGTARESYHADNYKWATVQAYYSIFHAARALLYDKGFREKSHRGLLKALGELYPKAILSDMLESFEESMNLREAADYGLVYSEEGAKEALENAQIFLEKSMRVLSSSKHSARTAGEDLLSYLEKSKTLSRTKAGNRSHRQRRPPEQ
jgi:uncharacterized protein (UPF0332 family)